MDALLERQMPRSTIAPTSVGSFTSGNCTLSIVADGPVTQETLTKLIKFVELIKDGFPKNKPAAASESIQESKEEVAKPALRRLS